MILAVTICVKERGARWHWKVIGHDVILVGAGCTGHCGLPDVPNQVVDDIRLYTIPASLHPYVYLSKLGFI